MIIYNTTWLGWLENINGTIVYNWNWDGIISFKCDYLPALKKRPTKSLLIERLFVISVKDTVLSPKIAIETQ